MLIALISTAWLTIATFVIVACRMAAQADAAMSGGVQAPVRERVVVHQRTRWQRVPIFAGSFRLSSSPKRPTRSRGRGSSCATGS